MRAAQRLAVVASAHADSVARVGLLAGCYAALAVSAVRREEPQEDPATEDLVAWLDNRTRNFDTRGFRIAYPPEVLKFLETASERASEPGGGGGGEGALARFGLGLSVSRRNLVRCRGGKAELLRNYELQKNLGRGGYATVQRAREKHTGLLRAVKVRERARERERSPSARGTLPDARARVPGLQLEPARRRAHQGGVGRHAGGGRGADGPHAPQHRAAARVYIYSAARASATRS